MEALTPMVEVAIEGVSLPFLVRSTNEGVLTFSYILFVDVIFWSCFRVKGELGKFRNHLDGSGK